MIPAVRVKSGAGKQTTAPNKSFLANSEGRILKRHALGIVFRKPFLGGLLVGKDLQMVDVADILAGIDLNPDGFHLTIL